MGYYNGYHNNWGGYGPPHLEDETTDNSMMTKNAPTEASVNNVDHAYGYTGHMGYYNGYHNNWGGYGPPSPVNTDHAYGYTGHSGYYNGPYNNWGGYGPPQPISQNGTDEMVGPRTGQKEANSETPAVNVGLLSYGYPGHLGYNSGPYLNWGLYGHRHLPNVATHTKIGYYGHPGHLGYYNGYHNGMWGRFSPCHYPYQGYI